MQFLEKKLLTMNFVLIAKDKPSGQVWGKSYRKAHGQTWYQLCRNFLLAEAVLALW